jgi:phosphomannomutase
MRTDADLRAAAERWMTSDPDPRTQAELRALLEASDLSKTDLADRFAGSLEFGTAGLRGVLGAGPNRMNRAVVLRTTWGLASHLLASFRDAGVRGVVVGYDGRRMSRELAEDTACVLAAAGIHAHLFPDVGPTPLTAFAVRHLDAVAGVMVTASHNPPEYNGYKVYWSNAAQIIPPIDSAIAARIAQAPPANEVPRAELSDARAKGLVVDVPPALERAYLDAAKKLSVSAGGDRTIRIVYTPLHGVGGRLVQKLFGEAGFTELYVVAEQFEPDGAFSTVAFPNPEEKGAMDLSLALARKVGADLVLANDPDADRLAVALPDAGSPTGYVQLTGNQVGVLLGHYLLTTPEPKGKESLVIASIVSSPMLGAIASKMGVRYEETLTGFKWIANRAMELERSEGLRFVFGYEEALGYTVGDLVRDKDGVTAALLVAELAAHLRTEGKTLLQQLALLSRAHGLYVSSQVNVIRKGAEGQRQIAALMDALRASPPRKIGAHDVVAVSDYQAQTRTLSDGTRARLALPKSNVLTFDLAGGSRVIARPSGTEPKAKFYFDVCEPVGESESLADAERRANRVMKTLADEFVKIAGV